MINVGGTIATAAVAACAVFSGGYLIAHPTGPVQSWASSDETLHATPCKVVPCGGAKGCIPPARRSVSFKRYDRDCDGVLSATERKQAQKDFSAGRLSEKEFKKLHGSKLPTWLVPVTAAAVGIALFLLALYCCKGCRSPEPARRHQVAPPQQQAPSQQVADDTDGDDADGLHVAIVSASGLPSLNNFTKDHPFVAFGRAADTSNIPYKTGIAPVDSLSSSDPVWNETHFVHPWSPGDDLVFHVFDEGIFKKFAKPYGTCTLESSKFEKTGFEGEIDIVMTKTSAMRPKLKVSVKPGALPQGWKTATDPASGDKYYYNVELNISQWDKPTTV